MLHASDKSKAHAREALVFESWVCQVDGVAGRQEEDEEMPWTKTPRREGGRDCSQETTGEPEAQSEDSAVAGEILGAELEGVQRSI